MLFANEAIRLRRVRSRVTVLSMCRPVHFVNRNEANAMRQKLLSDGYNAIVQ